MEKRIEILARRMFPRFVWEEYPTMITFTEKVLQYMNQEQYPYDVVSNLLEYNDVDRTLPQFESVFKSQYLANFPDTLAADVNLLVKNVRSFYLNKGTEQSFRFLFSALFDSTVNFKYPKFNILRASDGLWYTPTYIVMTDDNNNIPPQVSGGQDYNINKMIDQFITGTTSGAVAFVENTINLVDSGLTYGGSGDVKALSIVEKEGTFITGEQILIGDTIVENGDFSQGLSFWNVFPTDDTNVQSTNNQLTITQPIGDPAPRYVYQAVNVEESIQYWLRYSLVSADANQTKVTVGYTPGANDIYDSTYLGTGPSKQTILMNPIAAGKTTIYITIHNEMSTAGQKCIYDGISLVKENTAQVPLLFIANQATRDYTNVTFSSSGYIYSYENLAAQIESDTTIDISNTTSNNVSGFYVGNSSLWANPGYALVVTGSTSNDGVYSVTGFNTNTPQVIQTGEVFTPESPGATVTLMINAVPFVFTDLTFAADGTITTSAGNFAYYVLTSIDPIVDETGTATITSTQSGILDGTPTWKDLRGMLSEGDKDNDLEIVLQDNEYYQDFSYEVKSQVSTNRFESIIKDLVHPAGFKMFAKVIPADDYSTYALRESLYDDLVFSVAGTITRTASGVPFDLLFRKGDRIRITNSVSNDGDYIVDTVTSTVVTVRAGLSVQDENAAGTWVDISSGVGILDLTGTAESLEYAIDMHYVYPITYNERLYEIDYSLQLGFGNTWQKAELTREANSILVGDWASLIIGDFEAKATSRFGFINSVEIDVTP